MEDFRGRGKHERTAVSCCTLSNVCMSLQNVNHRHRQATIFFLSAASNFRLRGETTRLWRDGSPTDSLASCNVFVKSIPYLTRLPFSSCVPPRKRYLAVTASFSTAPRVHNLLGLAERSLSLYYCNDRERPTQEPFENVDIESVLNYYIIAPNRGERSGNRFVVWSVLRSRPVRPTYRV